MRVWVYFCELTHKLYQTRFYTGSQHIYCTTNNPSSACSTRHTTGPTSAVTNVHVPTWKDHCRYVSLQVFRAQAQNRTCVTYLMRHHIGCWQWFPISNFIFYLKVTQTPVSLVINKTLRRDWPGLFRQDCMRSQQNDNTCIFWRSSYRMVGIWLQLYCDKKCAYCKQTCGSFPNLCGRLNTFNLTLFRRINSNPQA